MLALILKYVIHSTFMKKEPSYMRETPANISCGSKYMVYFSFLPLFHRNLHATKNPFKSKIRFLFISSRALLVFFNEKKHHRS